MGEEQARALINQLLDGIDGGDVSVMESLFADDAVLEWPASGERVVGLANRKAVYANMPTLPKVSNRYIYGTGDLWIAEATLTYGTTPYNGILVFQMRDGKISKQTGYWAQPSEPPEWRSAWVERIDLASR